MAEVGKARAGGWTRRLPIVLLIVAAVLVGLRLIVWLLGIGAMEHRVCVQNATSEALHIDVWLGDRGAPVWRFPPVPEGQSRTITAEVHAGTHYEVRATFPDGEEVRTSCGYQTRRFHDVVVTVLPNRLVICTHTEYGSSLSW